MFRSVCALYSSLAVCGSSQESLFHLTADCVLRPCALLLSPIYVVVPGMGSSSVLLFSELYEGLAVDVV